MKIIKYIPKITSAKTQYVDIDAEDMVWLQTELIRWLALLGELDGDRNEDVRQIMRFWWYKRSKLLPKGHQGQNSPLTFVSGLINNLMFGTQRNLSTSVMEGIEYISGQIHALEQALEEVNKVSPKSDTIKFSMSLIKIGGQN